MDEDEGFRSNHIRYTTADEPGPPCPCRCFPPTLELAAGKIPLDPANKRNETTSSKAETLQ